MDHIGGLQVASGIFVLIVLAIMAVRSGIGEAILTAWCTVAMILRAIVYVPWGLFLLAIGFAIIWMSQGNIIAVLIGGWLVFKGGNYLFGSLGGFLAGPSRADTREGTTTATRADLRKAGLIGRR